MSKLAALIAVPILFVGAWTLGSTSESRTSFWTCELNAFFTSPSVVTTPKSHELDGQGLMNCRNAQGFAFDQPVRMRLRVQAPAASAVSLPDLKVTMYARPFTLLRDLNRIYDRFDAQGAPLSMRESGRGELLVSGRGGLVLPLDISVPDESRGAWSVSGLEIAFDDEAPTLQP